MVTTATMYAQTTRASKSVIELRQRVLALYRQFMRKSPDFAEIYEIDYPTSKIRTKLRQEFERHRFVDDLNINNILLAKGQMEFQETINFWKQKSHVLRFFAEEESTHKKSPPSTFLDKFIKGTA